MDASHRRRRSGRMLAAGALSTNMSSCRPLRRAWSEPTIGVGPASAPTRMGKSSASCGGAAGANSATRPWGSAHRGRPAHPRRAEQSARPERFAAPLAERRSPPPCLSTSPSPSRSPSGRQPPSWAFPPIRSGANAWRAASATRWWADGRDTRGGIWNSTCTTERCPHAEAKKAARRIDRGLLAHPSPEQPGLVPHLVRPRDPTNLPRIARH